MGSTLLTAGLLVGFIILFVFLFSVVNSSRNRKKFNRQQKLFQDFAAENNFKITRDEQFVNYNIAIDSVNGKVIYKEFYNSDPVKIIDLKRVKESNIDLIEEKIYEEIKGKNVLSEKRTTKIQLVIIPQIISDGKEYLILYQLSDGNSDLSHLKSRAAYWSDIINDCVKSCTSVVKKL